MSLSGAVLCNLSCKQLESFGDCFQQHSEENLEPSETDTHDGIRLCCRCL